MANMTVATWNVNGIRARGAQVLDWMARERPDVVCLQEIKATPEQVPTGLRSLEGYWCYWHGGKGYSGVGLLVSKSLAPEEPGFFHPPFDFEHRIVAADIGGTTVVSVYVPNGGKDLPAKIRFLGELDTYTRALISSGHALVVCGDINVARTDRDVHPKERKPTAIGQLPEERLLLDSILQAGLVDLGRALDPDNENLFTWWPPWRDMRARNIGWRIDYILASASLAARAMSCPVRREVGTSDHAPVLATFAGTPPVPSP